MTTLLVLLACLPSQGAAAVAQDDIFIPLLHSVTQTRSTELPSEFAANWPMKQRDIHNTGRADFVIPESRLNEMFFESILWQSPAPGSPTDGGISSTSMVFFDGAGPGGADIVVAGYHWPKGVQGMDRYTGEIFWNGLTAGGEAIGTNTPAFSNDGSVVYVINDHTGSPEWPEGHPLMAFSTTVGPSAFWHSGANPHFGVFSPAVAPDGRIFTHSWADRPYAAIDNGSSLLETWAAETNIHVGYSSVALFEDDLGMIIVAGSRWGFVSAWDGDAGDELWQTQVGALIDAPVTIDPVTGNIYVGAGDSHVFAVGLDRHGDPLWDTVSTLVHEHVPGQNNAHRAQSAGCLSHDGLTYYFQTNSQQGDGRLYAINTLDGSVRWSFETGSTGWESVSSSPIVTPNGIVVVGNNQGGQYFVIRDAGTSAEHIASFMTDGTADASATLSSDGILYLPLRSHWTVGNGSGDLPTGEVGNLFTAFNLLIAEPVTIHVPSDYPTIQAAIDAASNGDEIVVAPGIYAEAINLSGRAVHLRSTEGADATVIDASGLDTSVVTINSGEGPNTIVDGFTITGGTGTLGGTDTLGGGGMLVVNSSPTVVACHFVANTADHGGGLLSFASSPTIVDCLFLDNATVQFGGGGIYANSDSTLNVESTTFINNAATTFGGCIHLLSGSAASIANCTFYDNFAAFGAAGVMLDGGSTSAAIENSVFAENTAEGLGGAGVVNFGGTATITDSILRDNVATANSGAILHWTGVTEVVNSKLRQNIGAEIGGILAWSVGVAIGQTLFCGNEPGHIDADWIDLGGNVFQDKCAVPGDLNNDGVVDGADLLILLSQWGKCGNPEECPADLNNDGVVDGADLLILLSNWG